MKLNWTMPPPAPANDNFANAQVLSGASGQTTGTNAGATKETGEPAHAGNGGGKSVWYRWTPTRSGNATIETTGSDFDTLLGVYTGSAVNALTTIASNDDVASGTTTSKVAFAAVGGTTCQIAVDGFNGASGTVVLIWAGPGGSTAGDYDGNGTTDIAVYRPSTGAWFVRNGTNAVWGVSTDIPLPLPNAIYRAFF